MAYVPNPTDTTNPTDAIPAETAQAEFRALKGYLQTLVLGASGVKAPVRQTVIAALIAAGTGLPAYASAGAGLNVNILATAYPIILSAANGFNVNGPVDVNSQITVDTASFWANLPASNTSYLSYDILTAAAGTATQSIAPYQESYFYNQAAQSLLQFGGVTGSTTFLDDYGNTWTRAGAAKTQSNSQIFGTNGLGGGGTNNALDGATDYITSASFTSLGSGSWALRCWVNPSSLPGNGVYNQFLCARNAAGYTAADLFILNTAGTIRFGYDLSSTGTSQDIVNAAVGVSTPVVGTNYFVELTYDALAGTYRLYVNGTQEQSTASALKVCAITAIDVGAGQRNGNARTFFNGYINKVEFLPYCSHPAGTAYVAPVAAPSVATQGYSSDFFSISQMEMFQVTGPSTVAGNNPAFTQKNRVYMAEADTSGAAVSAIRIRPLNGYYRSGLVAVPASGVPTTVNHNLGIFPGQIDGWAEVRTAVLGLTPGQRFRLSSSTAESLFPLTAIGKNSLVFISTTGSVLDAINPTTGSPGSTAAPTNCLMEIICKRGWGGA